MKHQQLTWTSSAKRVVQVSIVAGLGGLATALYQTPDMPSQHAGRMSPWRGVAGCTYLNGGAGNIYIPIDTLKAATPVPIHCVDGSGKPMVKASVHQVPIGIPSLTHATWRFRGSPGTQAVRAVEEKKGQTPYTRAVVKGADIELTIAPEDQTRAQSVVLCMTGNKDECKAVSLDAKPWENYYEGAAVRMAGLFVLDIATGINALGSAHTPCFEAQNSAGALPANCPQLPTKPVDRPYRLLNHALYTEAMPGSLIKLFLALAFLNGPLEPRKNEAARLPDATIQTMLKLSDSEGFMDEIFCKRNDFTGCTNLQRVEAAARQLGWNKGCTAGDYWMCAKTDPFLSGNALAGHWIHSGNTLLSAKPAELTSKRETIPLAFDADLAKDCATRAWSRCSGANFAELTAEMWGQGNSMASPAGIADMFARTAQAANGHRYSIAPRLVSGIELQHNAKLPQAQLVTVVNEGTPSLHNKSELAIPQHHATTILGGLQQTHTTGGTAHSACIKVFKTAKACNEIDWIAGKTATPVFSQDRMTLTERNLHCAMLDAAIVEHTGNQEAKRKLTAQRSHCFMNPFKWYAAALKTPGQKNWSKVVVAIVERNYDAVSGKVDAAEDRGANLAAVMALAYAKNWKEQNAK
jgi:hypothetical protein